MKLFNYIPDVHSSEEDGWSLPTQPERWSLPDCLDKLSLASNDREMLSKKKQFSVSNDGLNRYGNYIEGKMEMFDKKVNLCMVSRTVRLVER